MNVYSSIIGYLDRIRSKKGIVRVSDNGFWSPRYIPYQSLKIAAQRFNEIGGKIIIEIGSGVQGSMSGDSILVWATKTNAEKIYAFDLDERHVNDVKRHTSEYPNVICELQDGIKFLGAYSGKIHLLYLDFWTEDPVGSLTGEGRAKSYLEAYIAARTKLDKISIILIDDTDHIHPWKHSYIIPEARKDGFKVEYTGRQTLLIRQ